MSRGIGTKAGGDRWELPGQAPSIDAWMARRILAGWTPKAIVAAAGDSISLRTVYRWKRDLLALEEVTVDGWTATFVRRRYKPPCRVSAWKRVA